MDESSLTVDTERFKELPTLSTTEAAWMAGVTLETYERFMSLAGVEDLRSVRADRLVRAAFTLLGQKESQSVMLRLQLAAALQREKELAEALQIKVSQVESLPFDSIESESVPPNKKHKKKKKKKDF